MIAAPMMSQGVQVNTPKVQAKNISLDQTVQVIITKDKYIYVDHTRVYLTDLEGHFKKKIADPAKTPVVINADTQVEYGFVIEVINLLRNLGIEKLGFLTRPKESE